MKSYLEINSDLGEGFDNDAEIMPLIDACNIACGGHAGNDKTIRATIQLAQKYEKKIGMHPSFPDILNFGRKRLNLPFETLRKALLLQVHLFNHIANQEGAKVNHLKLHGALYNMAAEEEDIAEDVIQILKESKFEGEIYAPPNSALAAKANEDFLVIHEVFIDRNYNDDLTLVSRYQGDAILEDPKAVWDQYKGLKDEQSIRTISEKTIPLAGKTACIHGDTQFAVEQLSFIRKKIEQE